MKLLLLAVLMVPAFAFAQTKKIEITGSVSGLPGKTLVYLTDANNPTDTLGQSVAVDGKFTFKGEVDEPNLHHLQFSPVNKRALLFIGEGKIKVEGDINTLTKLKVTGSASHDDFASFQKHFNPIFERLQQSAQPGSNVTFTNDDYEKLEKKLDSFIYANKDSYVAPFVIVVTSQLTEDMGLMERRFTALNKNIQQGFFGKYVKEMIDDSKVGAVGSDAIDFTQNDTTGAPITLSSFRGKYVLIDFWASWCGPCRAENPNVVSAFNKFKNKNFTILGVSLDRARPNWIKAIHDDNLTWTQVSDLKFWSNEVAAKYKVQSIPQNFLIDPSGKIVAKNLRGEALESKLCELLGCN